jgi:hypothetical protein
LFRDHLAAVFCAEDQMDDILRIAMGHRRVAPPGLAILLPFTHREAVGNDQKEGRAPAARHVLQSRASSAPVI